MMSCGTQFESALAFAWRFATREQSARLRNAFPEIYKHHSEQVQKRKLRDQWKQTTCNAASATDVSYLKDTILATGNVLPVLREVTSDPPDKQLS
jgi:hypothetical protein